MTDQKLSARVRANRANARKSTGPKTAEGRERVSRNALKHGLSSAKAPPHDADVLTALIDTIVQDYSLTESEAEGAYPLAYRVAEALLTLLKISAMRNEHWRRVNLSNESGDEDVAEHNRAPALVHMFLSSQYYEREERDLLRNLKRLERYKGRAEISFRRASNALADWVAALPARVKGHDPSAR